MNRTTRNIVLTLVSVALLIVAAYRMSSSAKQSKLTLPDQFVADGHCMACGQDVVVTYPSNEAEPHVCPECGKRAVYNWRLCRECNYRFIPKLEIRVPGEPPRPVPFPTCPHCGCSSYRAYSSFDPDQHPDGDAKLPKWPVKP